MTRGGVAYAPPTSPPRTSANDCSCSPDPTPTPTAGSRAVGTVGGALLPTPIAGDTRPGAAPAERRRRGPRPQLSDAVTLIPITHFSTTPSSPGPGPHPRVP